MKKEGNIGWIALAFAIIVILVLVFSGPASAFSLNLSSDKNNLNKGEKVSFTASLEINSGERLPVDYLYLEIVEAGINCRFLVNGTSVSGCDGIEIKVLSSAAFNEGNLTGEDSETEEEYDWGYGYGYTHNSPSVLSYEIILDTSPISPGEYSTKLNAKIKNDIISKEGEKIKISEDEEVVINIYSPREGIYKGFSTPLGLNVTTSKKVKELSYRDFNSANSFTTLCRDCEGFGFSEFKQMYVKEGENIVTIRAKDEAGRIYEKSVSFFLDSGKPYIKYAYPEKEKYTNGSLFYVEYYEDYLEKIILFYWNKTESLRNLTREDCLSGNKQKCSFSLDLKNYSAQEIEYWFEIQDSINSASSDKRLVKVDVTSPVINSLSLSQKIFKRGRYILGVNVTESNFKEARYVYYDVYGIKHEENLCSSLRKGICEIEIYYPDKAYGLQVIALDLAGNSAKQILT